MNGFGKLLRSTSLDELPEVFNILRGDMSIVGPRPQLVRDMVFMTQQQRKRYLVRPGLSGLAQVNGRNEISWEDKLAIIDGVAATAEDYGDYLLHKGMVEKEEYERKHEEAKEMLGSKKMYVKMYIGYAVLGKRNGEMLWKWKNGSITGMQ